MKRVISILLCLVVLLGMIPTTFASGTSENGEATLTDETTISGTNSFGNLLSNELQQVQQKQNDKASGYSGNYGVIGFSMEGNTAEVEYYSLEKANLIVALYSEDGMQLLTSGHVVVSAEETTATVVIEGTIPQYFMVSAYLVDIYDYSPLCAAYETPMYTQDMQELLASSVDDYAEDKVLNLDENADSNFAVYNDAVVVIEGGDGVNTVTQLGYDNNTYVIENADQQITGLTPGTVMAYSWAPAEVLILKVSAISQEGTTVTITGSELELEEVFDYLKLETEGDMDAIEVDDSECEEGIAYEGIVQTPQPDTRAVEGEGKADSNLSFTVNKEYGSITVSGGLDLQVEASISYYLSLKKQHVELKTKWNAGLKVSVTGALPEKSMKLAKIKVVTPVPGVVVDLTPKLVFEAEASLNIESVLTCTVGFSYDSKKGFKNLSSKPKLETQVEVEGKLFLGIKTSISLAIVDEDIASIGVSASFGFQVTGLMTGTAFGDELDEDTKEVHDCNMCLALSFDSVITLSANLTILKNFEVEKNIGIITGHLFDRFCSFDPAHPGYGKGKCNYKKYYTRFSVEDPEGNDLENITIQDESGTVLGVTSKLGTFRTYLSTGSYTFTFTDGTQTVTKDFDVEESGRVNVVVGEEKESLGQMATGILASVVENIVHSFAPTQELVIAPQPGVAYKLGAYHNKFDDTYFLNGKITDAYAGSCTDWDTAVDIYLLETTGGYHLAMVDQTGITKYINIGTADTYGYYIFADEPQTVYEWDETYNTLTALVDGVTWFFGMHVSYDDFLVASVSNITKHYPISLYELKNNYTSDSTSDVHSVRGAFGGDYSSHLTESYMLQRASFTNLVPGEEYLLLAMASATGEQPLTASNLLFVDQTVAAADGTLVFEYVQRELTQVSYVVACGASNKNLKDAQISLPVMCANGQIQNVEPKVVYDGVTLKEGQDYTVVGDMDFTDSGSYTCYIRGIYNYAGLVPYTYTVLESSMVSAWNLTLGDRIAVNFYMDIQESLRDTAQINITVAGKTVSYSVADSQPDEDSGLYTYSVSLAAPQMTEKVTIELIDNGQILGTKSYTVRQYADYVLGENSGVSDNVKALVREMLNYGGAAQTYFDYRTDDLANAGIDGAAANDVPYGESEIKMVTEPTAGKAYKYVLKKTDGILLYFNGNTASGQSYYLATTTDVNAAADVYLEEGSDGLYRLYFMKGNTKTYIRIYQRASGNPGYGKGSLELTTSVPNEGLTYDTTANTLVYCYDSNNAYYVGTYGTYKTFSTSNTSYITGNKASNVDVSQFPARFYEEQIVLNESMTVTQDGSIPGLSLYGTTMVCKDQLAVRYYFTGKVSGCTFTVNGESYTLATKNGKKYIEVSGICPQNMDQKIDVTVTDAQGNVMTVSYNPMNYIVRMSQKDNAKLTELLKALYNYHLAAKQL